MAESNGEWGDLASHDKALADVWDAATPLPAPGENDNLDAFVTAKNITIPALVRIGTRLTDDTTLVFAYPGGLKFRNMVTGRRWSYAGSSWGQLKIVPSQQGTASRCIVAEGETDGARLTLLYPTCDVAIQGGGAKFVPATFAHDMTRYDHVLIGLDPDEAGELGAEKWSSLLPNATRFAPPAEDWCALDGPPPTLPEPEQRMSVLVPAGELVDLETPDVVSWFEHAVLPVGGLLVMHGWIKSFKSYGVFDILSCIAQGQPWACFEPTEEPAKVAVIQYEIPWPYYQDRVRHMRANAREQRAFDENYMTWDPMRRPQLTAGNKAQEDAVLSELVKSGTQVVAIDPIRRFAGTADVNNESEVRTVLRFFERCQDEGITVVTTHHDNKQAGRSGGDGAIGMTGSGAFGGDPDTVVSVELPPGDDYHTSTRRNLRFTFRNAPMIGGRGMEMTENGVLTYTTHTHGYDADEAEGPEI
jgi:hypothetical protein